VPQRPAVSVVVPFAGSEQDLHTIVTRLGALDRSAADEVIIVDNRVGARSRALTAGVSLYAADAIASPGFARNRGAAAARGDWLVFLDADTDPDGDLLAAYFTPLPATGTAVLAGAISDVAPLGAGGSAGGNSLTARHAVARAQMSQRVTLERSEHPYAQSANLAVRRDALIAVGGFAEHARAGEDADLCFRLREAGFGMESRPAAGVNHRARADLRSSLLQLAIHGSGADWCNRRHPGTFAPPGAGQLLRRFGHSARVGIRAWRRGDREQAGFAMLEIAETLAFELGRLLPNRPRRGLRP
jgi:glycosyltransferase involved in cell wall biosynthesis